MKRSPARDGRIGPCCSGKQLLDGSDERRRFFVDCE
jgi:hypothetical protein